MKHYLKKVYSCSFCTKSLKIAASIFIILITLDLNDVPSKLFPNKFTLALISIGLFVFIILISIFIEGNFIDAFKLPIPNDLDLAISVSYLCILLYVSILVIANELYPYKCYVLLGVLFIISLGAIVRFKLFGRTKENVTLPSSSLIDLKDLYEGNVTATDNQLLLIDEKAVDYDLLNRREFIEYLSQAAVINNPNEAFVISLEGKWGSGKSTLLNNLKKSMSNQNNKIIIIDDFDPWPFGDENILLLNMLDLMLRKTGYRYSALSTRAIANNLASLILGTEKNKAVKLLLKGENTNSIVDLINQYIESCGSKIIFFIENLDRSDPQNVISLLKLIGSVLNFSNVTYVLTFDPDRMQDILSKTMYTTNVYLHKIIQMQIPLPEVDQNILRDIYLTATENLLDVYGKGTDKLEEYRSVIEHFCGLKTDLRDFKRYVNSTLSLSLLFYEHLHLKDLLLIHIIQLFNPTLFLNILENKVNFISHDRSLIDYGSPLAHDPKLSNSALKKYFEDLFSAKENIPYKDILATMFPFVRRYLDGQDIEPPDYLEYHDPELFEIAKSKRICSAKYFDLYFTKTRNVFSELAQRVEEFISDFNNQPAFSFREAKFWELFNSVDYSSHSGILERTQLLLDALEDDARFDLISILFSGVDKIDDSPGPFILNARRRVEIIITELLKTISDDQFQQFLSHIEFEYGRIRVVQTAVKDFERGAPNNNLFKRHHLLDEILNKMQERIFENSLNLYESDYYMRKNIFALYGKGQAPSETFKKYIKNTVCKNNVFKFLYDQVQDSYSFPTKNSKGSYGYSIRSNIADMGLPIDELDHILGDIEPKTDDEKFILRIYRAYVDNLDNPDCESVKVSTPFAKLIRL